MNNCINVCKKERFLNENELGFVARASEILFGLGLEGFKVERSAPQGAGVLRTINRFEVAMIAFGLRPASHGLAVQDLRFMNF